MSCNFLAFGTRTSQVHYFGEDLDGYKNGQASHEGAWRAGQKGAQHGTLLPGTIRIGARYYQQRAPGTAVDWAEPVATNATVKPPLALPTSASGCGKPPRWNRAPNTSKYYLPASGWASTAP